MRPKSIATVVVVLVAVREASSTPTLTDVMAASVVSGAISEMAATKVVLPTANPPATAILTGSGPGRSAPARSELTEAIQDPLEEQEVGTVTDRLGPVHLDQTGVGEVADEHPGHAER